MKTIARIKDIAERAGVSTGTVDRVIHNRGRVDPDVQKRVQRILGEMRYEPNLIARALGSKRDQRIAVIIPNPVIDPYWLGPKEGIEKAGAAVTQYGINIQLYIFNPDDAETFVEQARKATDTRPDGSLLSPIFSRDTTPFFKEWEYKNIPFVLFNTQIPDSGALSYVGQDSYQSGLLAGKLAHYGQPQPCGILILHIDEEVSNATHLAKKEQGFRDYFKQNGLNDYKIVSAELNRPEQAGFSDLLSSLIKHTPNLRSIYVTTSKSHVIAACIEQKTIPPVKLMGYDLLPKNVDQLNKGMISFLINQNPKGQGYWGIHQLVNHLVFKKEIPALKYLPLDVVTKENAVYYTSDELIYDDYKLVV